MEFNTINARTPASRASSWLITTCGVWLVGLGPYFVAVRPPLLPEDTRFMGATIAQLQTAASGLEDWLKKVFTVMGGFMAGTGVLTVFAATVAMPSRLRARLGPSRLQERSLSHS